jgi:pilus assembly protein CpaB
VKLRYRLDKKWIILVVATTIGILAAVAASSYLSTQMAAIEARGKGKTVKLIVAKRELKRGDRISADTVAVRDIPVEYAQSSGIAPDTFDRVEGQPLAYPVHAGEMILWGVLEGKKVPTFSARVEAGHRAMTVSVDEINSISGLLEPGDLIDLLVTIDQKGKRLTLPLLQKVQVMATGQRVVDSPREGERRHYSTVTIDIAPAQAQQVILARDAGKITALLRNPEDHNRLAGGNADMTALLSTAGFQKPLEDAGVPVLYGGATRLTPDALVMGRAVAPARAGTRSASNGSNASNADAIADAITEKRASDPPASDVPVITGQARAAGKPRE